jgi:hypothetical protein
MILILQIYPQILERTLIMARSLFVLISFVTSACAALAFVLIQGCGASGASIGYSSTVSYGGSGSAYTAVLNPNLTFTLTKKALTTSTSAELTVSGTFNRLTSGILALTVTSSSDTTNGPAVGAILNAIDVPGYVLMLKAIGSTGGEVVPMVATGTCPSADFAGTWVKMQDTSTTNNYSTDGLLGTFAYTHSGTSAALGANQYRFDGTSFTPGAQSLGAYTCSSGVGTLPNSGNTAEMYFTSGGGAVVRVNSVPAQAIAMVPSAALTVSSFAGTYVGLAFDEGDTSSSSAGSTLPISVTLAAAGTGTGAVITNVSTNALSTTQTATLVLSQLSPTVNGALKLAITPASSAVQNTICAAATAIGGTTQNVIFCAGTSPSGTTAQLRSYLLVTKRT